MSFLYETCRSYDYYLYLCIYYHYYNTLIMEKEYIVLGRQDAVAKNNSPYANLRIASSKSDILQVCVFDTPKDKGPHIGQVISFIREMRDYQGKKSANLMDLQILGDAQEGTELYKLVPRPIKREEWDGCIERLCSMCSDKALVAIISDQKQKLFDLYVKYPAATQVHHAFPGGLLNHTYQMLHMLEGIFPTLPYQEEIKIERCVLAIMFHDWGKTLEYDLDGETTKYMYLLGHIFMSAQMLNGILSNAGIDKEESRLIVHCVLSHHGELEYGSPIKPCIPEAQLVNYLDNISAKADIFHTTGNMEKNFALGTHVVKSE